MSIAWTPTEKDFENVRKWGHIEDPFAAVKDFSFTKLERRWLNPEQETSFAAYVEARNSYIGDANFDEYYRVAEKPIDRLRWEYLKLRKSWFQMPLGWDNIAKNGGTVFDLGCGDGDTSQLLIDYVVKYWKDHSIEDKELVVKGFDLNPSRIRNSTELVSTEDSRVSVEFSVADLTTPLLESKADYAIICGVLEILEPDVMVGFLDQVCDSVTKGIYIEDLFEQFPGGYPNDKIGRSFASRGFQTIERQVIMTEPYNEEHLMDPMKIWPNHIDQNLWLEPSNR